MQRSAAQALRSLADEISEHDAHGRGEPAARTARRMAARVDRRRAPRVAYEARRTVRAHPWAPVVLAGGIALVVALVVVGARRSRPDRHEEQPGVPSWNTAG